MSRMLIIYVINTRHTRACEMSDTCPPHGLLAGGRRTCEQSLLQTRRPFDHKRAKEEHQSQKRTVEGQQVAWWNTQHPLPETFCGTFWWANTPKGECSSTNTERKSLEGFHRIDMSWMTGSQSQCGSSSQRSALDVTGEGLGIQCLEPWWADYHTHVDSSGWLGCAAHGLWRSSTRKHNTMTPI